MLGALREGGAAYTVGDVRHFEDLSTVGDITPCRSVDDSAVPVEFTAEVSGVRARD